MAEETREETTDTEAKETDQSSEDKVNTQEGDFVKADFEEEQDSLKTTYKEFGGLFEDESQISQDELMGKEPVKDESTSEEKKPATDESKDESKKTEEEMKAEEEAKAKAEQEAKEKEEAEAGAKAKEEETQKPPKGYVPNAALREARDEIKSLREELAEVKAIAESSKIPADDRDAQKWKDFKVLTDQEYDALLEDDPTQAIKYDRQLRQYESYMSQKRNAEEKARTDQQRFNAMVDEWSQKINEAIPGIYEGDSDIGTSLAEFAEEMGFENQDYLNVMTDPRTLVIPHGSNETFFLGPGVMDLLKMISNAKEKISSNVDPEKLRAEITKEITGKLEKEITERVTKELTEKLKGSKEKKFRSLTEAPGGGDEIQSPSPMSEEEWARLRKTNPEKADAMLMGE